ncbi:molybdopterin molybdotransferase MoeA [Limisphaera ngatamarikiensis]|uniref:Molybdopterin molybdenumtransferase n=1 Tax=Limisphaera ngatamarikiensis TaxID=1324935 RepID=A0A6M1RRK1_9BACT|nr:molybdopterin molybdotransferase MoeA [Limisphaera ngatamarikiensis]NGO40243.1 molybdopterin molybdotransferase MoeA [Limisphaera ngatamarikiensis]
MQESAQPPHTDWDADAVCRQIAALCPPLEPEAVPLHQALGRRLRQSITAPEDLPPFDRSAMDGFAIRRDDPASRWVVVDRLRAGDWRPRTLQPGQAVAIATGAALPCAGLQVIPREFVHDLGNIIEIRERPPLDYIRRRGEDARAGDELVPHGVILQPGTLALLASLGHTRPQVTRRPTVWHLTTGSELVDPAETPGPGQIRDSNSILVQTFCANRGLQIRQWRLPEEEPVVARILEPARRGDVLVDLLLISGGASVGPHDFTRNLLEQCGYEVVIARVRARPGRPLIVARRGRSLAIGLPGNPLAHWVCLHIYVDCALRAWEGAPSPTPPWKTGLLTRTLDAAPDRFETFWPARWCLNPEGRALLEPLPWRSSGDLTALATANAILRLPPQTGPLTPSAPVSFLPLNLQP